MSKIWNKKEKEENHEQEYETTITHIYKQRTTEENLEREIQHKQEEITRIQDELTVLQDDLKEIKKL